MCVGSATATTSSSGGLLNAWKNYVAERQGQIDRLNERVELLTRKAVEKQEQQRQKATKDNVNISNSSSANHLAPEFVHSQQKMTILTAGAPVYQLRAAPLVYLYTALALALVGCGARLLWTDPHQRYPLVVILMAMGTMFLGYDIYSGVLHVVFDHPANIALPILGQPCLEFQWHHSIPDDLVRKDFVDVCGDLNTVIGLLIGINLYLLNWQTSGLTLVLGGTKLLMAYFGQFSHRSAHCVGKSLGPVPRFLQQNGFMVSTKAHLSHHQPPYNVDYCLVGPGNALIDAMRKLSHNNTLWLSVFLVWSVFDIYILTIVLETVVAKLNEMGIL